MLKLSKSAAKLITRRHQSNPNKHFSPVVPEINSEVAEPALEF